MCLKITCDVIYFERHKKGSYMGQHSNNNNFLDHVYKNILKYLLTYPLTYIS